MNIVLTGASSGIGYYSALEFLKEVSNVVFVISRNKEKLLSLKLAAEKSLCKGDLVLIPADLRIDQDRKLVKEEIQKRTSSIDVLINNAAELMNKPFEKLSKEDWISIYSTNVFAVVNLIQDMLPLLSKASEKSSGYRSHIINIGSMGGLNGTSKFPGLSAYSSSKAALSVLTECLAVEFKELKIAVNCLALGSVQTEMFSRAFPGYTAGNTAESIAIFIADFANRGEKYFNGKNIPVSNSTP